ncbi:MAG: MerR family transcriptional regulator [Chloroflexi bacterium]|nr:MerR family transcriptional regulator [Chloroflexota bacterium]
MSARQHYRVGQVAALTGVPIRTLHHYDSIGLLHPSRRLESGHRLYSSADLLQLQQILTLRYLGFELRQIRELLRRTDFDVIASLRILRGVVLDRIAELQRIEESLSRLLDHRLASGGWDWQLVMDASATVQHGLEQKGAKMNDYYTPEEIRHQAGELAQGARGEELRALEQQWRELLRDVHANLDLPPESAEARELAERWDRIHEEARPLFRNDEKLWQSIGRAHLDGRYDYIEEAGHAEDYAFMRRVKEAPAH